jgi:hypothetical protein
MDKQSADNNDSSCNKSILRRKRAIEYSQKKVSALFIYGGVHYDDEHSVEVGEDVPAGVGDGGMILEENSSEAIAE